MDRTSPHLPTPLPARDGGARLLSDLRGGWDELLAQALPRQRRLRSAWGVGAGGRLREQGSRVRGAA